MWRFTRLLIAALIVFSTGLRAWGGQAFDPNNPIPDPIPQGAITIGLETIASNLVAPNYLTDAGDGTNRLFVVDQPGTIRLIKNGQLVNQPFLDVGASGLGLIVDPLGHIIMDDQGNFENPFRDFDERGLLGLAFHPDFSSQGQLGSGKLYTYTSEPSDGLAEFKLPAGVTPNHQATISEWQVDPNNPDSVDTNSRRILLRVEEPQFNHDAGGIYFGPDKQLYIPLGDGGSSDDNADGHTSPGGNAQDTTNVLGALLRIDPLESNSSNGQYGIPAGNPFLSDATRPDEMFAYGLRNPFRASFDGNNLIIGDVGQRDIEEVNVIDVTTDNDGVNFGWRVKEGTFLFTDTDPGVSDGDVTGDSPGNPATLNGDRVIDPVLQYDHDEGITVIGGFVYRGSRIPELVGKYVFGDFSRAFFDPSGRLFYADLDTGLIEEFLIDTGSLNLFVKGFGQDPDGELYVLAGTNLGPFRDAAGNGFGVVLQIVPEPASLMLLLGSSILALVQRRPRLTK